MQVMSTGKNLQSSQLCLGLALGSSQNQVAFGQALCKTWFWVV